MSPQHVVPPSMSPQHVVPANIAEASPAESSPLLPVLPRFLNGNSLSVLTQWLDLAFARLGMTQRLHRTYNEIRSREQRPTYTCPTVRASDIQDSLPAYAQSKMALSAALGHVFPVFQAGSQEPPLASTGAPQSQSLHIKSPSNAVLEAVDQADLTSNDSITLHAITHAVSCAARNSDVDRQSAERYFGYAFGQLPAILEATQPLDQLRVLVLMSLYLRWRDDVERAWQILALAVASVQNHGLHRDHKTSTPDSEKIFWCVFVLDKLLSVELERRPMLSSAECNRTISSAPQSESAAIFKAIVEFAKLQDEILEKLLHSRRVEEVAQAERDPALTGRIIRDKLHLVAELDQKLLRFADNVPHGVKPSDYLYANIESLPGVTFLAVQYYQAVFMVSRNALLINMDAVQSEITRDLGSQPGSNRLRSGMNVCTNAARSILSVLNHAEEMGVRSPLLTPYAPLMAMYALTIHVVRRQSPATARVDLELQATAMNLIKTYNSLQRSSDKDNSTSSGLLQMLERLHTFSANYIQQSTRHRQPTVNGIPISAGTSSPTVNLDQWRPGDTATRVMSPPQSPANYAPGAPGVSQPNTVPTIVDPTYMPRSLGTTAPLYFNDDWFTDMGQDAMNIDWDELAVALGLPTGVR